MCANKKKVMKRIAGWGPLASREVDLIIFGGAGGKIYYSFSFFFVKLVLGPTLIIILFSYIHFFLLFPQVL